MEQRYPRNFSEDNRELGAAADTEIAPFLEVPQKAATDRLTAMGILALYPHLGLSCDQLNESLKKCGDRGEFGVTGMRTCSIYKIQLDDFLHSLEATHFSPEESQARVSSDSVYSEESLQMRSLLSEEDVNKMNGWLNQLDLRELKRSGLRLTVEDIAERSGLDLTTVKKLRDHLGRAGQFSRSCKTLPEKKLSTFINASTRAQVG
jgi:hypothetical protein